MKPEAAARLEELVARATVEPPAHPIGCWCALNRARFALEGTKYGSRSLSAFAATLGFTDNEANGIMNGWDTAEGADVPPFENYRGQPGFAEGNALGKQLFAKYGACK